MNIRLRDGMIQKQIGEKDRPVRTCSGLFLHIPFISGYIKIFHHSVNVYSQISPKVLL